MHPILLTIGSWEVRSYGFVLSLAVVLGVVVFWCEGRRAGFRDAQLLTFCAGAVASGLLGGNLNARLFQGASGLTSYGSIGAALAFGSIYARRQGWSVWAFLDVAAPVMPLVEGVMRWGCLLNGCCYGSETRSVLGMYSVGFSAQWAKRYPTQLMLSLFCLALSGWLWRQRKNRPFDGASILSYLIIYGVGRLAIDALRGDQRAVAGLLTVHQMTAVAIVGIATVLMSLRALESGDATDP